MPPPKNKTKIVATIGPASETPAMLERLIRAGLNVARLNFSHGDFTGHAERIKRIIRTVEEIAGTPQRMSVSFKRLPKVVKPGDRLFLNDGLVQLTVEHISGSEVQCKVSVGGELRSKKGLNLPGIALGISAFTDQDRACLEFALRHGVDAVPKLSASGLSLLPKSSAWAPSSISIKS